MAPPPHRAGKRLREAWGTLRGDSRGAVLVAVAVGWLLALGIRLVFPALLPPVRAEFDMDLTTAGVLLTLLWAAYAAGQFPGGMLADRVGERAVLAASSGIATGAVLLVALSPGFRAFFVGTVLFGLGTGLYATTRFTVISDVYPDRDATALGLTSAAGNVGAAVLPAAAGVIAAVVGWRVGFWLALPLFVATTIALFRVVPRRTSAAGGAPNRLSPATGRRILAAIGRPAVVRATAAMLLLSVVYQGFTGFFPTYLHATKGIDQGTAAMLFGLFFATGIAIQPLAGAGGDRFGTRPALAATGGVAVTALAALPFVDEVPALAALTLLASAQLGFWPVVQSYVIEALPADIQGSGFGLLRTGYLLVASTGPAAVGALADRGHFDLAFGLLAVAAGAAVALALALPVSRDRAA